MKVSKRKLQSMIREQLLKEYMDHSHKFKMMTWKACNLDLPDGFVTKKGAGSINKAEKAALSTAKYLWNFLSGMSAKHNLQAAA